MCNCEEKMEWKVLKIKLYSIYIIKLYNIPINGNFYLRWMTEKVILCANCGKLIIPHMIIIIFSASRHNDSNNNLPKIFIFFF